MLGDFSLGYDFLVRAVGRSPVGVGRRWVVIGIVERIDDRRSAHVDDAECVFTVFVAGGSGEGQRAIAIQD